MDPEKEILPDAFVPTQESFDALLNRDGRYLLFVITDLAGEVFVSNQVGMFNLVAGHYLVIGTYAGMMQGYNLIEPADCDWTVDPETTTVTGTDHKRKRIYQFISKPRSE